MEAAGTFQRHRWSPYNDNGGTTIGIAGKDFAIIGGDTRMSDGGYSILSRDVTKLHTLNQNCVIGSSGQQSERTTLWKVLDYKITMYKHDHKKDMSAHSFAQMLGNTLYYKRFFPYYTFNVVAGLDNEGKGAVWGYDAVGSFEKMPYCVTGSGSALITSILDNQVAFKTQEKNKRLLTVEETLDLIKDAFTCAGERDIYSGDFVDLAIITKDGVKTEKFQLKRD